MLERLSQLSSIFTIEICAYAVLSNHYHLVLFVDQTKAKELTREQVVERWAAIFGVPSIVARHMRSEALEAEGKLAESIIEVWRTRLSDISWLMKCLNEYLARRANAEDQCTGKFWEGRFKSQALLDDAGLLTAMTYVDLNPIRAGIAATPEESEFTSIQERIRELRRPQEEKEAEEGAAAEVRIPMRAFSSAGATTSTIPYRFDDYLELVDWTGRTIRSDKRGSIDERLPPIVQRLNIDPDAWHRSMQRHGNVFGRAMGRLDHLRLHAHTLGQSWVRGLRRSEALFNRWPLHSFDKRRPHEAGQRHRPPNPSS